MKREAKLKEIADLEQRVSSLEGGVRALADLVRVPPLPFVLEPPFASKTEAERILGPRIA